jgi:cytochrome P450
VDLSSLTSLDPETVQCPYHLYAKARAEGPGVDESLGAHVVSRYDEVVEVLRDNAGFSSAEVFGRPLPPPDSPGGQTSPLLLVSDEPLHGRKRSLLARAFTPRQMRIWQPQVTALADQMIDTLCGLDEIEFVRDFAAPFPIRVVASVLGVQGADADQFRYWSEVVTRSLGGEEDVSTEDRHRADQGLIDIVSRQLAAYRDRPADSILALIGAAEAAGALTHEEAVRQVMELLVAGNITTTDHLGNSLFMLANRPDLANRLRSEPDRIPAFVEESLRLESPLQGLFRRAVADRTVGDVEVPAGDRAYVLYGAANRDEDRYPDADALDLERSTTRHVAFGFGAHACLGAPLARLEGQIVVERLLARTSAIDLVPEEGKEAEFRPSFIFRGLRTLPLRISFR